MRDINHDNIGIYVETLFALARDAWLQGRQEAFDFVRGYLVGLVPSSALDAFIDGLPPPFTKQVDASRPAGSDGGSRVSNPVPPPAPPPPPAFRPRESETLRW